MMISEHPLLKTSLLPLLRGASLYSASHSSYLRHMCVTRHKLYELVSNWSSVSPPDGGGAAQEQLTRSASSSCRRSTRGSLVSKFAHARIHRLDYYAVWAMLSPDLHDSIPCFSFFGSASRFVFLARIFLVSFSWTKMTEVSRKVWAAQHVPTRRHQRQSILLTLYTGCWVE